MICLDNVQRGGKRQRWQETGEAGTRDALNGLVAAELYFDVLTKSKSYPRQRVIVRVILHLLHLTNPEKETRNECLSHPRIFKSLGE